MDNSKPTKNESLASQGVLRPIKKAGARSILQNITPLLYQSEMDFYSAVADDADRGPGSGGFAGWSAQQPHFMGGKQYFGGLPVFSAAVPRNDDAARRTLFPIRDGPAGAVEHKSIVSGPLQVRGPNVNDSLAPTIAPANSTIAPAFFNFSSLAAHTPLKRSHAVMLEGNEGEDARSLAKGRPILMPPYAARPDTQQEHDLTQASQHKPAPVFIDLTSLSPSLEPPARETYLHRLPAELRNRIYYDIGLKSARLDMVSTPEPALTIAIPDLRDELHSIIFSENKLRVSVYTKIRKHSPEPLVLDLAPKVLPAAGIVAVPKTHWMWHVSPRFVNIKHICFRVRQQDDGEALCDFFVNMRIDARGKLVVRSRLDVFSHGLRQRMRPVGDLARAVLRSVSEREGFQGLSWEDAQRVAACFVSVEDAEARIARKCRKVMLV